MATRLNISQGYYNKIESGKKTMSLQRTLEIAAILNLDVKDLIKSNNKSA
jgi:transcriptional regulator with XRE-family HTH domain